MYGVWTETEEILTGEMCHIACTLLSLPWMKEVPGLIIESGEERRRNWEAKARSETPRPKVGAFWLFS